MKTKTCESCKYCRKDEETSTERKTRYFCEVYSFGRRPSDKGCRNWKERGGSR